MLTQTMIQKETKRLYGKIEGVIIIPVDAKANFGKVNTTPKMPNTIFRSMDDFALGCS